MATQTVLGPLTRAAIFLVATVEPGGEPVARELLAGLSDLVKAVRFRIPEGDLRCVAGVGSDAWDRLFPGKRPAELHPFPELHGEVHSAPATPGDLLFHLRAQRMDLCFELAGLIVDRLAGAVTIQDEVYGFQYFDRRDLLGFVDGTANPENPDAPAVALIGDEDPDFAGGSYVIVQKYLHDLTTWNQLTAEEQERVIGRTKLSNVELPDGVKPGNSHVALTDLADGREIVRDNMPFGSVGKGEFGTYFIGYARSAAVIELMLRNMFLGNPPGNHDRILDFSTAVTGTLFYVPTVAQLESTVEETAADGSLQIGSLT